MATLKCQHTWANGRACDNKSKLADGQRRFCGQHHKVHLRSDPEYQGSANAYNADPELVAARAGGDPVFLATAERAARERQQPGIFEAERLAQSEIDRAKRQAEAARRQQRRQQLRQEEQAIWDERFREEQAIWEVLNRDWIALGTAQHTLHEAKEIEKDALERTLAVAKELAETDPSDTDRWHAIDEKLLATFIIYKEAEVAPGDATANLAALRLVYNNTLALWNAARAPRWAVGADGIQVVFQRDPAGGIDLRALGNDSQSVHRSGVISAAEAAVHRICARPIAADQSTLKEALPVLPTKELRSELQKDYNLVQCFGVPYSKVLDHVWGTLRTHEHRTELERRFTEEMTAAMGMCHAGKMTRLVNVLAGFDDAVGDLMPPMEMFQNRIALLAKRPMAEREPAARDLFREFGIAKAEQSAWLETLIEA